MAEISRFLVSAWCTASPTGYTAAASDLFRSVARAGDTGTMLHAAVVDIGKPGKNLGFALAGPSPCDGTDLDAGIVAVVTALRNGLVALGFEAPMFGPIRDDPMALTKARRGEAFQGISRPFSARAGATVLVTALVVVTYVMCRLRARAPTRFVQSGVTGPRLSATWHELKTAVNRATCKTLLTT
jgi:hypothetical protein